MAETYEDLIYRLGDLAYERLWDKPDRPKAVDRAIKTGEILEQRKMELQEIEQTMDAEEQAYNEFRQACEEESAQCDELVQKYKKAVQVAESKANSLEAAIIRKRKDILAARTAVEKLEKQAKEWAESGLEDKAKAVRASLKQAKLDLMKRNRECDEMQAEFDKLMNPESGPGAEGIRARRRQIVLDPQLSDRSDQYNQLITELNDQAAAKDEEVKEAQAAFDEALTLLGEEVYAARIADPTLAPWYPRIDRALQNKR
jgi:chromosome segregation ATPase